MTHNLTAAAAVRRAVGAAVVLAAVATLPIAPAVGKVADTPSATSPVVTAKDLGTLPGDNSSQAMDINNHGLIVGVSMSASNITRAVVWHHGDARALPGGGSADYAAFGVNDSGVVVGRVGTGAAMWTHGRLVRLETLPGGSISQAEDISNNGVVVGYSSGSSGRIQPVVWFRGHIRALSIPAGRAGGHADGVSDSGFVAGTLGTAVRWKAGVPTEFASLEGDVASAARDVNDQGLLVGFSQGTTTRPVVWSGLTPVPLDTPAETNAGMAEAVNRWGNVAGWVQIAGVTRPVVWWHGTYVDLGSASVGQAYGFNDHGRVVGWAGFETTLHATVWKVTTPDS